MKDNVFDILKFRKSILEDIALLGNINDQSIRSKVDKNIRKLNSIADANLGGHEHATNPLVLKELIARIKRDIKRGTRSEWTISELRSLAYNLSEFHNNEYEYSYTTTLLDELWSDRLFRGLNYYLMSYWNLAPKNLREKSIDLLQKHLTDYGGDNKRLLQQKENIDFFMDGGPIRLAQLAKARNVPLAEVPRLIGYSPDSITLDYFSDTILTCFQGKDLLQKQDEITDFLLGKQHTRRTKMLMSVRLVKMADNASESMQTSVTKTATSLLGEDVTKSFAWDPFIGATDEEKGRIEHARVRISQWIVKKVINVFFEKCVQDVERKNFWLRYVKYISQFKIVGSSFVRANLNSDSRIHGQINGVFRQTNQAYKETAALVLWIKDKIFVEFSDVGALYVYVSDNTYIRRILSRTIEKVEDLKMPTTKIGDERIQPLGQLIEIDNSYYGFNTYNEEGKLNHRGDWVGRLSSYMSVKMDINMSEYRRSQYSYD